MTINGRAKHLTGEWVHRPDCVTLRVDSETDAGFWLEVALTEDELRRCLAQIEHERGYAELTAVS